jgi:hypothetical protein
LGRASNFSTVSNSADDLGAFGLRDAAGDRDGHFPAGGEFHLLELAEFGIDLLGRLLADMARIDDHEVGAFGRVYRRIAERLQHIADALGVVDIHLAAIGPDKQALQRLCVGGSGHRAAYA